MLVLLWRGFVYHLRWYSVDRQEALDTTLASMSNGNGRVMMGRTLMNQLAFSSKQPQDERALQWSPQVSPTHRRRNSSGRDGDEGMKPPQRHLHVQFAVQNVPPSPLMYQQQRTHESSLYERNDDAENDRRGLNTHVQQQQSGVATPRDLGSQFEARATSASIASAMWKASAVQATQRSRIAEHKGVPTKQKKKKLSVPRKPDWDADVKHTASFFDTSIKRSTLFQPKPSERRKEIEKETQRMKDRPQKASTQRSSSPSTSVQRRVPSLSKRPNAIGKVKSTVSNSSTLQLPPRPVKDFVRLNFERITGRPYDQNTHTRQQQRRATPNPSRQNVFERLSKPQIIPKSLLRSVRFSESTNPKHASAQGAPAAADSSTKVYESLAGAS